MGRKRLKEFTTRGSSVGRWDLQVLFSSEMSKQKGLAPAVALTNQLILSAEQDKLSGEAAVL